MAENYEPEYPWVLYGDGGQARFIDDRPVEEDKQGVKLQPLLIVPSKDLIRSANIQPEELTENVEGWSAMWVKYPVLQVDWLKKSPLGAVLFIWCSFRGEPTVVTQKLGAMFEWDIVRDKREQQLKYQSAWLMNQLKVLSMQVEVIVADIQRVENKLAGPREELEGTEQK